MIEIKRNGKVFYTLEDVCDGSKLSRQLMDHHYVILKFTTVEPVYFEIGDSVEIADFGYFELTSAYFPKSSDGGYEYELQMDAYYMAWKNKICKYRPQYGANETSFKLTTKISVHANVILSNLKALGYQYNGKDYSVDFSTYNKDVFDVEKRFLVEYDSISIIDAITTIAETLECEWWIDGSIIYFGYCEMVGQVTFEQGKNVLSMSYSESKANYITRLYAFGSDKNIPKGYFTGSETDVTTDGIATDYLMLPTQGEDEDGFVSKDGYLENVNVVKNPAQAIEGVVMFDDEYPRVVCAVSSIKTYDSTVKNDDGTTTTQTFWQVTSDDSFAKSFEKAWIKENLTLMIKFTSGMLLGMEFEVSYKVINNVNYFEIVANDTYGRTLPDNALYPKYGDKFFLYNWDATKITETDLIQKAQMSLLERSKTYYKKSMISNANFDCEMDAAEFYNGGIYNYHPLGEQVKLINPMFADVDKEGKHYRNSRIIGMDIKLDIPYDAPTYVVGERPSYSKLGQLEDKVDSITVNGKQIGGTAGGNGVYVIGLNDSTPATDSNVYSARRTKSSFLSKLYDDIAKGTITFEKLQKFLADIIVYGVANLNGGANIGSDYSFGKDGNVIFDALHSYDYENADQEGYAVEKDGNGKYHQYISNLTVWGKMHINELEINKLSYAGGSIYLSGAGNKIVKCVPVVYYDEDESEWYEGDEDNCVGWKCYLLADNGEAATENHWKVGDQVRCQTMGEIKSGGAYKDASNKSYWRTILEHGVSTGNECIESENGQYLYDGQKFAWIVIGKHSSSVDGYNESNAPEGTRDYPSDGDVIVLDGSRTDSDRQNVLILESVGDYAPRIVGLSGVNTYSHDDKDVVIISPKGVKIKSSYFKLISESNENVIIPNYRGLFSPQFQYHVGDQVSYNNAIWTCIKDCWQIEPNDGESDYWSKDVYGVKGDSGVSYTIVPSCGVVSLDENGKFVLSDGVTADTNDSVTIACTLYKTENGTQTKENYAWWQATPTEALPYAYLTDTATIGIENTFTSVKVDVYNCYLDSVSHRPTKGNTLLASITIPVVKDGANGQNGQDGSSFKVLGTAEAHYKNYAQLTNGSFVGGKQYLVDDASGFGGTSSPSVVTYQNTTSTWLVCKSDEGDSYMIGDDLWTNSGTTWLDIGNVKGVSIKQTSITYAISDSATTAPTSGWQSSVPATSASSPYLWTKVEVTYSDNTKTTSYSVSRQGTNGDDGKDALEIIVYPDTILLEADENGLVSDYSKAKSTITCRRGGKDVTSKCTFAINATNCTANMSSKTVNITYVARQKLSDDKTEVSYPSGGVLVQITDTDTNTAYLTQVKFIVNVAKYTGELLLNDKEFAVRMEKMSTQIGELPTKENVNQIVSTEISSSATTIKAEAVKQTKDDMKSAGLEITSDGVTLYGDKITINNGETTVALFQDGKINVSLIDADNIEVKHLWAKNSSGTKVGYFGNTEEDACKLSDGTLVPVFIGSSTAKNSPFYVTSKGAMHATSGYIGGFNIEADKLVAGEVDVSSSMELCNTFVRFKSGKSKEINVILGSYTISGVVGIEPIPLALSVKRDYADSDVTAMNNGIFIDVSGNIGLDAQTNSIVMSSAYPGGNHALFIRHGDIAGFRFMVSIAKVSRKLTDMENLIYVPVTGITLTLPDKPQIGQYYKFIQGSGGDKAFYVNSSSYLIYCNHWGAAGRKSFDSGHYNQTTEMIFLGDHWRVNWFTEVNN